MAKRMKRSRYSGLGVFDYSDRRGGEVTVIDGFSDVDSWSWKKIVLIAGGAALVGHLLLMWRKGGPFGLYQSRVDW